MKNLKKGIIMKINCRGNGQKVVSPSDLTCQCINGVCDWSWKNQNRGWLNIKKIMPMCVTRTCSPTDTATNGWLSCSRNPLLGGYHTVGTQCDLKCEAGFDTKIGSDYKTCDCQTFYYANTVTTLNSTCDWSRYKFRDKILEADPIKSDEDFYCKNTNCEHAADIEYGKAICPNELVQGSKCSYECDAGYALVKPVEATCTCPEDMTPCSYQTPIAPTCTYDISSLPACNILFKPDFGDYTCSNNTVFEKFGETRNTDGTICEFTCQPGYEISKSNILARCDCQANSGNCNWKMVDQLPICSKIDPCRDNPCGDDGPHECLARPGTDTFTCQCAETHLFDPAAGKCVVPKCPDFNQRMDLIIDKNLEQSEDFEHYFEKPFCIYPEDKAKIDAVPEGEERRAESLKYRWEATPGKYLYFKNTICYPRCLPDYDIKGKNNYKCICKRDDPNFCDWSAMKTARNSSEIVETTCEFKGTSVIKKERNDLAMLAELNGERYTGPGGTRNQYGSEKLYLPENAIERQIKVDRINYGRYKPEKGYFPEGVPEELQPKNTMTKQRYKQLSEKQQKQKQPSSLSEFETYFLENSGEDDNYDYLDDDEFFALTESLNQEEAQKSIDGETGGNGSDDNIETSTEEIEFIFDFNDLGTTQSSELDETLAASDLDSADNNSGNDDSFGEIIWNSEFLDLGQSENKFESQKAADQKAEQELELAKEEAAIEAENFQNNWTEDLMKSWDQFQCDFFGVGC